MRNGTRSKTVLTEATGHVEIDVPRDRAGTFEPQIVRKRQRRLSGVDEIVLSLYATTSPADWSSTTHPFEASGNVTALAVSRCPGTPGQAH